MIGYSEARKDEEGEEKVRSIWIERAGSRDEGEVSICIIIIIIIIIIVIREEHIQRTGYRIYYRLAKCNRKS